METYFAPAERANPATLRKEVSFASLNPIIDSLMRCVGGLLAVLNEHRQILALNDSLLDMLGIDDPENVLGLRPGEAIQCIHAHREPHGCGTTKFCSSCGAAIAIVTSLSDDKPVERKCAATVKRKGKSFDICLAVNSAPINLNGHRLLLLFLQDITSQEKKIAMQRTFYHDMNNIIAGLMGSSELMQYVDENEKNAIATQIFHLSKRLRSEVAIQRSLTQEDIVDYKPAIDVVSLENVVTELAETFSNHPSAQGKQLVIPFDVPSKKIQSDCSLLLRILTNMLINAFEASQTGDTVKLGIKKDDGKTTFTVWNRATIPENLQPRIFQRHFSTKEGMGRGTGTYAMKLFGEQSLGGTVGFTSSEKQGTTFFLALNA